MDPLIDLFSYRDAVKILSWITIRPHIQNATKAFNYALGKILKNIYPQSVADGQTDGQKGA